MPAVSAVSPLLLMTLTIVFLIFGVIRSIDRFDLVGIDIVQHEELRARARAVGHQIVSVRIERALQGDVAQRAAADAQHDQHFAAVAEMLDLALHRFDHLLDRKADRDSAACPPCGRRAIC